MNIKEIKNSFENLKQRLYKTEGQKAAAELNKVIMALNEASAEQNNTDKYKKAIQKIYAAVGKAEDIIKNSENLADLHSLISKLSAIKVGDANTSSLINMANKIISEIKTIMKLRGFAYNGADDRLYKVAIENTKVIINDIKNKKYTLAARGVRQGLMSYRNFEAFNLRKDNIISLSNKLLDELEKLEPTLSNISEEARKKHMENWLKSIK